MNPHRIFVIWNHPLFFESVRLLMQKANIEWIGASRGHEDPFSAIARLLPDTILVEEEDSGSIPAKVIELLGTSSNNIRIFGLSLSHNDLKIYHRERRTVLQAEDLLRLITNGEGEAK